MEELHEWGNYEITKINSSITKPIKQKWRMYLLVNSKKCGINTFGWKTKRENWSWKEISSKNKKISQVEIKADWSFEEKCLRRVAK